MCGAWGGLGGAWAQNKPAAEGWPLFLQPTDPDALPTAADQALEILIQEHSAEWTAAHLPGVSPNERRAALEALFTDLEGFIREFPDSRWELSIHLTLGTYYQRQARWSRALSHLVAAWSQSQDPSVPAAGRFADRAQVALGHALLELGRVEALEELMRQSGGRAPSTPALGAAWQAIREAWIEARQNPALGSLLCGAHALHTLARALGAGEPSVPAILQWATPQDAGGFTLARLQEIARRQGLAVQAVVRNPGADWVLPAVVHWKEDLWRTVMGRQGTGFWVQDPTRGRIWMNAEDLEAESTGFCLVAAGLLPSGWRAATLSEAGTVVGRSFAVLSADAYDEQCLPPPAASEGACSTEPDCPPGHTSSGGGGGPPGGGPPGKSPSFPGQGPAVAGGGNTNPGQSGNCKCFAPPCFCPSGLPRWRISEPFLNVWLEDEPWGYAPAGGPAVRLGLSYKLRDSKPAGATILEDPWEALVCSWDGTGYPVAGTSFGVGWASPWLAYVYHAQEGDPFSGNPDRVVIRTPGRGYLDLYLNPDQEATAPTYSTRAILRRLRDKQTQEQIGWELEYPGGERYQFAREVYWSWYSQNLYFLSSYLNPAGSALQFAYEVQDVVCDHPFTRTRVRLTQITDATGLVSTLAYTNAAYPTLVTSITDPYGRVARFAYDAQGYLTNLTDVAGIQASLAYATGGQGPPNLLWRLTTPYGATAFHITDSTQSPTPPYFRGVAVNLPEGRRQVAVYYKDANPNFPAAFNPEDVPQNLPVANALDTIERNKRNSFFWDPAQAAQLSTTNLALLNDRDYRLARTRHWLLEQYPKPVSTTVSWEQAPSPDGNLEGALIWYGHEGKPYVWQQGSSSRPNVIALVMPDDSTWYQWHQRNFLGYTTNLIER